MLKTNELAERMARYQELSDEIKTANAERDGIKAELLGHMREHGASITGLEAGGYRASLSFREYYGFNENTESGEPLSLEAAASRRKAMVAFFKKVDESLLIPASEKFAKVIEAWRADPKNETKPLPAWCKKSDTPILRVSGSGTAK